MQERLSSVWSDVQKTFSQINPVDENRKDALSTLTGLYTLYGDFKSNPNSVLFFRFRNRRREKKE
ncbi:MAG: hypothetical protein K5839_04520 [Treponemataceae bacterium]|nr:hypothetical protein [Treponemataceae bacterium]